MPYAFDDFRLLISNLPQPISDRSPTVRYLCALVAELAYYHVPQFEIDDAKRATVIPCEAYQAIVRQGTSTNILELMGRLDFPSTFVVVDRGVIAVGLVVNKLLFIGFRGTKFLFDWKINIDASMTTIASVAMHGPMRASYSAARVHKGFAEEAVRISSRIADAMRDKNISADHLFLTGHSLGGAVAALSERFFRFPGNSTIVLASPRYSDVSGYYSSLFGPPTQIARSGDIVPMTPPRLLGYMDHPYQFDTSGNPILPLRRSNSQTFAWLTLLFLAKRFAPHSMEAYRSELGLTAGVGSATFPLAPLQPL